MFMSDLHSDLKNIPFVKSPANSVDDLYEQYVHDLGNVLDRHVPLVSRLTRKILCIGCLILIDVQSPLGITFKRTWQSAKNLLKLLQLCHQIALCNMLVNEDKSDNYFKLISDKSHNSRQLWHYLCETLNRVSEVTLPSHESDKSLDDQLASFFRKK